MLGCRSRRTRVVAFGLEPDDVAQLVAEAKDLRLDGRAVARTCRPDLRKLARTRTHTRIQKAKVSRTFDSLSHMDGAVDVVADNGVRSFVRGGLETGYLVVLRELGVSALVAPTRSFVKSRRDHDAPGS